MKKLLTAIPAALLLMFAFNATYAADLKVGTVDLPKIVQESAQIKSMNDKLKTEFAPQQQKIVSAQDKLRAEASKLRPNSKISKTEREQVQKQVSEKQKQLQQMVINFQQKVTQAQTDAMKRFMHEVNSAVSKIAKEEKLDIVLLKPAVMYANNTVDITDKVLAALPKQ